MLKNATTLRGAEKVKQAVEQWIEENQPQQHDKFFTQRELAKMLNVDPMTAHKALNELTAAGMLYRRRGKGSFIGPDPKIIKKLKICLVSHKSNLDNPRSNPNNWHMIRKINNGILNSLENNENFSTIIITPGDNSQANIDLLSKYDAIFFYSNNEYSSLIAELIKRKAMVIINKPDPQCQFKCVKISYPIAEDAKTAIHYLLDCGYKKIAYIGSDIHPSGAQKMAGYKKALTEYGITVNNELIVNLRLRQNEGAKGAEELFNRKVEFDAIFIDTDLKAIGVIEYLTRIGINVPSDIGVMGFDGLEHYTGAPLYLTSIQPASEETLTNVIDFIRNDTTGLRDYEFPVALGKVIKNQTTRSIMNDKKQCVRTKPHVPV